MLYGSTINEFGHLIGRNVVNILFFYFGSSCLCLFMMKANFQKKIRRKQGIIQSKFLKRQGDHIDLRK